MRPNITPIRLAQLLRAAEAGLAGADIGFLCENINPAVPARRMTPPEHLADRP